MYGALNCIQGKNWKYYTVLQLHPNCRYNSQANRIEKQKHRYYKFDLKRSRYCRRPPPVLPVTIFAPPPVPRYQVLRSWLDLSSLLWRISSSGLLHGVLLIVGILLAAEHAEDSLLWRGLAHNFDVLGLLLAHLKAAAGVY
jgi:hypothetical protein